MHQLSGEKGGPRKRVIYYAVITVEIGNFFENDYIIRHSRWNTEIFGRLSSQDKLQ